MTFDEIVEIAKNGLGKPSFTYQSEQLAYLTIRNLLLGYRNQLVPRDRVLEEKEQSQKLFDCARLEEKNRFMVYKNHQENIRKGEELIHQLNHALKEQPIDREKALRLLCRLVDRTYGMTNYEEKLFGKE